MKKNLSFLVIILAVVLFTSCEKEVAPVNNPSVVSNAVRDINVDYAIYAASGNATVVIIAPDGFGKLIEKEVEINRMNETITFSTKSQQLLSVKARNVQPSHQEVMVSIYVNGMLFKSSSTTGLNTWAVAEGTPQ